MTHVINPLVDRAAGVIPRFTVSETEKILGKQRNHYRDATNGHVPPNCYRIRYDCGKCGQYEWLVPLELGIAAIDNAPSCHYCGNQHVSVDSCAGWNGNPLPFLGKPIKNFLAHRPLVNQQKAQKVKLTCQWCGKEFEVSNRKKTQRTCSYRCGSERYRHIKAALQEGK